VAERKNKTLVECARNMMKGKNISNTFWAEAINTAVYLKNKSPTRCLDNITPFEALYGSKPAVHNLKVFGCKAFAHIRLLISLATKYHWKLHQLDVKSPFLNGELKEFYLTQPKGFMEHGQEHLVCKLKKALYVLALKVTL
jgi:hypothetical protein